MMRGSWQSLETIRAHTVDTHTLRRGLFSGDAIDLLERIGPYPYGPDTWMETLTIEDVCRHPWVGLEATSIV